MNSPHIFLSVGSVRFRTARQAVAAPNRYTGLQESTNCFPKLGRW